VQFFVEDALIVSVSLTPAGKAARTGTIQIIHFASAHTRWSPLHEHRVGIAEPSGECEHDRVVGRELTPAASRAGPDGGQIRNLTQRLREDPGDALHWSVHGAAARVITPISIEERNTCQDGLPGFC